MKDKFSIDFLRHGETNYLEDKKRLTGRDLTIVEVDLTDLGIEQVKETARRLVNEINPDLEKVILWSSPAWRAQASEKIIKDALTNAGIEIYKKKTSSAMKPIKLKSNYDNEKRGIEANAMRFMKWITVVARNCKKEGKKLRIISVSHQEFLTPIMEAIFKFDIHHGEGYKKAEIMRLSFKYDGEMRGKSVANIHFDVKTKKFIPLIL